MDNKPKAPKTDALAQTEDVYEGFFGHQFNGKAVATVYSFLTDHQLWADQNRLLVNHFGADAPEHPNVLDLGSGTGIGTLAIAESLAGKGHVHGMDFSSEMVAIADRQDHQLANVSFSQGDATNMAHIDSDSMDYVVANSFLYLVPERAAVLREVRRVLKKGGRVVFMEPRAEGSMMASMVHAAKNLGPALRQPVSAFRLGAAMVAWRTVSGIEGRPTEDELRELFHEAGFDSVTFRPTLGGIGHHVVAQ